MYSQLYLKPHTLSVSKLSECVVPEEPSLDGNDFTNTKVVFTVGPSTKSVETLKTLLNAGVVCARFDFTWGTIQFHLEVLENLKQACKETGKICAVMIDTQGREVLVTSGEQRIDDKGWPWVVEQYNCNKGDEVIIVPGSEYKPQEGKTILGCNFEKYYEQCQPGDTIYLGRYLVSGFESASLYLRVKKVEGKAIICTADNNAELNGLLTMFHVERTQLRVDNVQNQSPILCKKDCEWMKIFSKEHPIDIISLSYCREAEDINQARKFLIEIGEDRSQIFSKLETRQALYNFKTILSLSDGIIISRGNLGLDILPEKIAVVQKHIITFCNMMAKTVMLTRIVDTMVTAPRPTRAEATDVSNAILDGVDGLMLGAETVRGLYPAETVLTVLSSCRAAEKVFDAQSHFNFLMQQALKLDDTKKVKQAQGSYTVERKEHREVEHQVAAMAVEADPGKAVNTKEQYPTKPLLSSMESIASSAVRCAEKINASLIVVFSQTGVTSRYVAKYRPSVPVISLVVPSVKINKRMKWELQGSQVARQGLVVRGLYPILAQPNPTGQQLLDVTLNQLMSKGLCKQGDNIVTIQKTRDELTISIAQTGKPGEGVQKLPQGIKGKSASQLDLNSSENSQEDQYIFHTLSDISQQPMDVNQLKADYDKRQTILKSK